jgi:hypothetical protein
MNYYLYNTDARVIKEPPYPRFSGLIDQNIAVVGGDRRRYGEQLNQLEKDDILLMYENRKGVVAIGWVQDRWDQVSHTSPLYYTPSEMSTLDGGPQEYRIGVKWVDISNDPIGVPELKSRLGYIPRGAVRKIIERRAEVERLISDRVPDGSLRGGRLSDEVADRTGSDEAESYTPEEGDRRERVERQICERRGQQQFRDALRERYGERCPATEHVDIVQPCLPLRSQGSSTGQTEGRGCRPERSATGRSREIDCGARRLAGDPSGSSLYRAEEQSIALAPAAVKQISISRRRERPCRRAEHGRPEVRVLSPAVRVRTNADLSVG